jgi:sec-independent protein translocase protein TatC
MGRKIENDEPLGPAMSLGDHLEELRARIILALAGLAVGVIAGFFLAKDAFLLLESQYKKAMPDRPLTTLAPTDAFVGYTKIAIIVGLIFSSPWVFYQLWKFVSTGLYPREKRYVYIAVPFSTGLFITGAFFFLFFLAPVTLSFFVEFGKWLGVDSTWTFPEYLSFITSLMLIFGLAFQTPIVVFVLIKTGLVPVGTFARYRKFVILAVAIIAAAVTPTPDAFTMIMLAVPLYLLFELGILLGYISERKRAKEENR